MKWLLILSLGIVGCNDAPPGAPGGGVPIPPGSGAGGSGGASGAGGNGGHGGGAFGACDNASDLDAIESADGSLRNVARDCGGSCVPNIGNSELYGNCVTECVEEDVPDLSTECASCYGDLERCGLEQGLLCRTSCQRNTCDTSCLNCLNGIIPPSATNCIQEYEDCRGLPGDGCPG